MWTHSNKKLGFWVIFFKLSPLMSHRISMTEKRLNCRKSKCWDLAFSMKNINYFDKSSKGEEGENRFHINSCPQL